MKKSFAILAAVLVTLCTTSTALAETPAPPLGDGAKIAVPGMPKLYYSPRSNDAPSIFNNLGSRVVEQGLNVVFEVLFMGMEPLTMTALFNGRPVDRSAKASNGTKKYESLQDGGCYIFVIKQVTPHDSGIYEIEAKNFCGECKARGRVLVLE